jgi:acyl-[acyl-carrier-protein]-phospholipid O-acyltransferase/long-chain-fatty-acid--[acyl-carrier-protein] ligase
MLEDLRAGIGTMHKLRGFLGARSIPRGDPIPPWCCSPPARRARRRVSCSPTATSSPTAHRSLARIDFGPADIIFNVLPVFHSFGLTGGLMLPLVSGVKTYLYPSPLHYRIIPELVYADQRHGAVRHRHLPHRLCPLGQRLRLPLAALRRRRRRAGEAGDAQGVVGALRAAHPRGLRHHRGLAGGGGEHADVQQGRHRRAALPALEHRLDAVDGVDVGGRLMLRGPNVMLGYLRVESPGVLEPPPEGWHDTGDIVAIDREGFVAIKGRA